MHRTTKHAAIVLSLAVFVPAASWGAERSLDEAMRNLKIPPDWLADVPIHYDTSNPWRKARIHIRQLLAQQKNREAIKLTYDYLVVRKVQEDTHEYPMYMYLGNEHAWAIKVYEDRLKGEAKEHTHESRCLASCYMAFSETDKAIAVLKEALNHLPKPPWRAMNEAGVHDHLGDIYARLGDTKQAEDHYKKAMALYRVAKPKYGRHLLPRRVKKVQSKLDLMYRNALDLGHVRDGRHSGRSLGYSKDISVTVVVQGGRIKDIKVQHQEAIEQSSTQLIPRRIVEQQSLNVDAVTGATVTSQAIVEATYRALQKAGMK